MKTEKAHSKIYQFIRWTVVGIAYLFVAWYIIDAWIRNKKNCNPDPLPVTQIYIADPTVRIYLKRPLLVPYRLTSRHYAVENPNNTSGLLFEGIGIDYIRLGMFFYPDFNDILLHRKETFGFCAVEYTYEISDPAIKQILFDFLHAARTRSLDELESMDNVQSVKTYEDGVASVTPPNLRRIKKTTDEKDK